MKLSKKRTLTQKDLKNIATSLKYQTAEVTNEMVICMLKADGKTLEFLTNVRIKKLPLILLSFKLGYIHGKSTLEKNNIHIKQQNLLFKIFVKLQKATTALQTTVENYGLGNTRLSQGDMMAIGCNANNISDMIAIASDYIYFAQQELEKDFLQ